MNPLLNTMRYKGYVGAIDVDPEAGVLHGTVQGIRDVVTFEAKDVEGLKVAFKDSVEDYLEMCAERGEQPEKPYSGKLVLRLPEEVHREAAIRAKAERASLNEYIVRELRRGLHTTGRGTDSTAVVKRAAGPRVLATKKKVSRRKGAGR